MSGALYGLRRKRSTSPTIRRKQKRPKEKLRECLGSPTTRMTDLEDILDRLGLGSYVERFVEEGFDTWETVLDITESDL